MIRDKRGLSVTKKHHYFHPAISLRLSAMHYLPIYEDVQSHQECLKISVRWVFTVVPQFHPNSLFPTSPSLLVKHLLSKIVFIAALRIRHFSGDSRSSGMLSALRNLSTAVRTQVISPYCPIYLLTQRKGYLERDKNKEGTQCGNGGCSIFKWGIFP